MQEQLRLRLRTTLMIYYSILGVNWALVRRSKNPLAL
ncbi:hypothetical protein PMIN01_11940 [Paraphaeosphaeria minitans]|uniref:Uncharacterized protein n=1 Tax=Paraphaeosphaeria minitans TaxID=565426 RepID=A0A9P6G5V4_9PLEO|nr:hypothetical protein PMIN01_13553 [Paraphaeosphaeria minitans]KAF9730007.1 hypothetical protein PMIN01_11940 [Paraphaeosphaeria minitans]